MSFEIEGTLHKIYELENKSGSFQTREFVLSTEGQYQQFVKFQLTQDKCNVIDQYQEGEKIKVSFDLRGREWQGKYFTNLNAWRVDKLGANIASSNSASNASIPPSFDTQSNELPEMGLPTDFNDLPF
jgi:single-strand DNA-binding protein